jgi:hypothetical protein
MVAEGKIPALSDAQKAKVVAAAVDKRLPGWAGKNHLVRQGDHYVIKAAFNNGLLTVNGEPLDLMTMSK